MFPRQCLSRSSGWPKESAKGPFPALVTEKETEAGTYPESLGEAEAALTSNHVPTSYASNVPTPRLCLERHTVILKVTCGAQHKKLLKFFMEEKP